MIILFRCPAVAPHLRFIYLFLDTIKHVPWLFLYCIQIRTLTIHLYDQRVTKQQLQLLSQTASCLQGPGNFLRRHNV